MRLVVIKVRSKTLKLNTLATILLSLNLNAYEPDCSIGVCNNTDLIKGKSLDQFQGIINALNKSADGDQTVAVKKLKTCDELNFKQLAHMLFGNSLAFYELAQGAYSSHIVTGKYAVINKDYIIKEVKLKVSEDRRTIFKPTNEHYIQKEKQYTFVQDRYTCELVKFYEGKPFGINKK